MHVGFSRKKNMVVANRFGLFVKVQDIEYFRRNFAINSCICGMFLALHRKRKYKIKTPE